MSTTQRRRSRFAGKPKVAQATKEPQELSLRMLYAPILAYVVLFQRLDKEVKLIVLVRRFTLELFSRCLGHCLPIHHDRRGCRDLNTFLCHYPVLDDL